MQLDSHRRQLSGSGLIYLPAASTPHPQPPSQADELPLPNVTPTTMPCRFSRFRPCLNFATPDPAASPATGALDAYKANRRTYLFLLRRQTRLLIFLFATLEAIWRGPVEIVFSKNFDAAIDHGFVYTAGYILSWIYMCFFGVIYGALFEVLTPCFPLVHLLTLAVVGSHTFCAQPNSRFRCVDPQEHQPLPPSLRRWHHSCHVGYDGQLHPRG